MTRLLLASASPRRRELLEQAGYRFEVIVAEVTEQVASGESAAAYGRRVALDKARNGFARAADPQAVVLGADTEVVLDGVIFGKPADHADAVRMLRLLSGKRHEVLTAVAVVANQGSEVIVNRSRVDLIRLEEAWIQAYVATGEADGKAGAYAIQGRAATCINTLHGSHSGVMGLPLCATAALLRRFGVVADWQSPIVS